MFDALITHPLSLAAECFKYSYFKYANGKDFIWENGAANEIFYVAQWHNGHSLNLEDRLKMTLICQKNGADNYLTYAYPHNGCPDNYNTERGNAKEQKILNKLIEYSAEDPNYENEEINAYKQSIALDFISHILENYVELAKSLFSHNDEHEIGGEQTEISIL